MNENVILDIGLKVQEIKELVVSKNLIILRKVVKIQMKVIIVGGVAGGATAATRIRRLDENAEIIVIERTGYISYANCGLPYYIGGVIEDAEELTLHTPESFWNRFRIDVRVRQEVTDIDVLNHKVTIKKLGNKTENKSEHEETYEESYDKLLLSPGAEPVRPDLPGINDERIFSLRTVEDTLKIRRFVEKEKPKTAVMVGGGFIGLEVAENLCDLGVRVTIVQKPDHLMNTLDYDMASMVQSKLRLKGITLKLNANVVGFEKTTETISDIYEEASASIEEMYNEVSDSTNKICEELYPADNTYKENAGGLKVLLKDGSQIRADMVLMAVGVRPETTLAEKTGLELGIKNAIVVNDKMETSAQDIYAVGDAIQVKHSVTGDDAVISLAGPANKQGRIAADNICGLESHYKGSLGSSVIKLFDMTVASTGITEKMAKEAGIDYEKVVLSPSSHAGYYPNAKIMTMKVLYEKVSLKILGAQIVGYDGVDKRIDVIATSIRAGLRADELKSLDLAYAPPYSSAKDPVNMAGFMIENIETGKIKQFHWDEIESLSKDDSVTLLDTRTEKEYKRSHAEGFINIPLDCLRDRMDELDKSKPVYVMCQSGLRSYIACRMLMQNGMDCYNFSGGYRFYECVTGEKALNEKSYLCGMDK